MISGFIEAILRIVFEVIVELMFHVVCYATGWVILKVATLGRNPSGRYRKHDKQWSDEGVSLLGLMFWIGAIFLTVWGAA